MVCAIVPVGIAQAQTTAGGGSAAAEPGTGYVEGVAQSALSNVKSQSYGAEAGYTIAAGIQVFVEAGRIRDAATADLGVNAQTIANSVNMSYTVKEPVSFGVAGVKYLIPVSIKVEPYVLGGLGVARYKKDVHFLLNGTDVTSNLAQYGVVLGYDLSGDFTKPMLTLGGGVVWSVHQRLIVDFQYRFGRMFAADGSINVSRAGVGVGFSF
jgi:opacity protein-like surface antigen